MKSPLIHMILASALCIATFVGYGMWYAAISAKNTMATNLQNNIDTKTETASRLAATRATLAGIAADESVVQSYFVPETSIVTFIDSLEAYGRVQKAIINVLSVLPGGTTIHPTLTLTLSVKGAFDAVMRTVGSIEYAPYDLSVSALSLVKDDTSNWHADFTLLVGSLPATQATTTVATVSPTALVPISFPHAYF